jgi:hypothetical protein
MASRTRPGTHNAGATLGWHDFTPWLVSTSNPDLRCAPGGVPRASAPLSP